ncbi:DUF2971 domain-containing protein [Granulicella mallensis]|uniref:DUF2971 domain-containing protein n=1 Tax=Granulicella mallensis TaxID=940614 RepID=A0A7W7ZU63_9BACT|nr:DUF2971 domain-containing protein [Granulicella mallensis]MBB5066156.1 hypothetical protein [Granulicella mallensis]
MAQDIVPEQVVAKPEPEVVYHYTSMEVLQKIIKSHELWATNVNYLNDVSEYRFFIDATADRFVALDLGPPHLPKIDKFDPDSDFVTLPFVTSLSGERDSLSQWRSYCTTGNGVSIGFRTTSLRRAYLTPPEQRVPGMLIPGVHFDKVRYVKKGDDASIDAALNTIYETSKQYVVQSPDLVEQGFTFSFHFEQGVAMSAMFHKDDSFRNECEYRLCADSIGWRQDLLRFRPARTTLTPYVEICIPNTDNEQPKDTWNAIESITIGPTPNMSLSIAAVQRYCSAQGINVDVKDSKVPYRDW